MKRQADGCFDMLGAPVGHAEHCRAYIRQKRNDPARGMLEELANLGDAHAEYKILSRCMGSCKVMYSMRTVPSDGGLGLRAAADHAPAAFLASTVSAASLCKDIDPNY
ncbi:unnamed protein product, partial [Polarella glacialis]